MRYDPHYPNFCYIKARPVAIMKISVHKIFPGQLDNSSRFTRVAVAVDALLL